MYAQNNKYKSNKCKNSIVVFALICGLSSLPMTANAGLDRAREAGLSPHKAIYAVRLSAKNSSSKVANITGKMFYEWSSSCDAWVSTHRFDMTYDYVEAPAVRVTSNFSTHESFDGKTFNFTLQRKSGGIVYEEIRGNVNADEKDYPDEVIYSIPEDTVFSLPKGTLFPMAHTLAVLEKIKSGQKFYNATIFDGSDAQGPVDINSFIAQEAVYSPSKENAKNIDMGLVKPKGWNIRLAFFPLNNFEAVADYEMSLILHENGVISDMEVDYGDFSVTQKLLALEPLDDSCASEGKK